MNGIQHIETTIGYDCREFWLASWNTQRRYEFLFRPDVSKPFSIDHNVWPSIFELGANEMPLGTSPLIGHPPMGRLNRLCRDMHSLISCLDGSWGSKWPSLKLTCFSLVLVNKEDRRPDWYGAISEPPIAKDVGVPWEFLGYDIADNSQISGLSNCGFGQDEDADGIRRQWASEVNDNHLLDTLSGATSFREMTNLRVKKHAPFFIYGIYSLAVESNPQVRPKSKGTRNS